MTRETTADTEIIPKTIDKESNIGISTPKALIMNLIPKYLSTTAKPLLK